MTGVIVAALVVALALPPGVAFPLAAALCLALAWRVIR